MKISADVIYSHSDAERRTRQCRGGWRGRVYTAPCLWRALQICSHTRWVPMRMRAMSEVSVSVRDDGAQGARR